MPQTTRESLNALTSKIIASAIAIHRMLGPGLLEGAYLACLTYELYTLDLKAEVQKPIPLIYRGVMMDCAYRADLLVEGAVLVEVKALETLAPIHSRQLYTYLRLADLRLGLLLNFGAMTMKEGIKRIVNGDLDSSRPSP